MSFDPLPFALLEGANGDAAIALATLPGRPNGQAKLVLRSATGRIASIELLRGQFRGPSDRVPLLCEDGGIADRLATLTSVIVMEVDVEHARRDWVYTAFVALEGEQAAGSGTPPT
jgi:hypothetical protein